MQVLSGSVVLLVGAGLLLRTLANVPGIEVGFNTKNLLLFQVDTRGLGYDATRNVAVYNQLAERISALPGVMATTSSAWPMLTASNRYVGVGDGPDQPTNNYIQWKVVRPNFLEVLGIPVVRGRAFIPLDAPEGGVGNVAVVNETLARRFFPDSDAIGHRFAVTGRSNRLEIIGIVRDSSIGSVVGDVPPTVFVPSTALPRFFVRTAGDPNTQMPSIRRAIHEIDSKLSVTDVKSESQEMLEAFADTHVLFVGCVVFGGVALLLTSMAFFHTA